MNYDGGILLLCPRFLHVHSSKWLKNISNSNPLCLKKVYRAGALSENQGIATEIPSLWIIRNQLFFLIPRIFQRSKRQLTLSYETILNAKTRLKKGLGLVKNELKLIAVSMRCNSHKTGSHEEHSNLLLKTLLLFHCNFWKLRLLLRLRDSYSN